jgi:hypothetical protein
MGLWVFWEESLGVFYYRKVCGGKSGGSFLMGIFFFVCEKNQRFVAIPLLWFCGPLVSCGGRCWSWLVSSGRSCPVSVSLGGVPCLLSTLFSLCCVACASALSWLVLCLVSFLSGLVLCTRCVWLVLSLPCGSLNLFLIGVYHAYP